MAEDSALILQEVGLGGRHKMGCGFFNPLPKPVWPFQS
ncbi:MAG: type I-MYXAN CRISPR-associated protein Cas6/Cmx6 [Acidobacteriota bacterium]